MSQNCIFCKIAKGKASSEKIYENEKIISFLDANPRSPGHSLVIPKKHVQTLPELDDETTGEILKITKEVEKAIKKALNPDAFTVGINDGEAAGQEIPHLHVNVIPRFKEDGGKPIHIVVNNEPDEKISEIAKKIQKHT